MRDQVPREHTGRVVVVALCFFGAFAFLGYAEGVFERLSGEVVVALAVFAAGYAAAAGVLDPELRAWLLARVRRARKEPAKSPARRPAAT